MQGLINISGVDGQPGDVRKPDVGGLRHGLQVVLRKGQLFVHVAGVLRRVFGIDGGLAGADKVAGSALDKLGLIVAMRQRPLPGIDGCALHGMCICEGVVGPLITVLLTAWCQQ